MATVELKGQITMVFPVEEVGANNLKKQAVMLKVPGYTDEFGDKKGKDEIWALSIIGDNIAKVNIDNTVMGRNAIIKCYVNSRLYQKEGIHDMYFIEATIASVLLMPVKS